MGNNFECYLREMYTEILSDPNLIDFYSAYYYALCGVICPDTVPTSFLPLGVITAKMLYQLNQMVGELDYKNKCTKPLKLQKIMK